MKCSNSEILSQVTNEQWQAILSYAPISGLMDFAILLLLIGLLGLGLYVAVNMHRNRVHDLLLRDTSTTKEDDLYDLYILCLIFLAILGIINIIAVPLLLNSILKAWFAPNFWAINYILENFK